MVAREIRFLISRCGNKLERTNKCDKVKGSWQDVVAHSSWEVEKEESKMAPNKAGLMTQEQANRGGNGLSRFLSQG